MANNPNFINFTKIYKNLYLAKIAVMNKHLILLICFVLSISVYAQNSQIENKYATYFAEAYRKYPRIPAGVLEAIAYTNTRIQHIRPYSEFDKNCQKLPQYYGVMGLVEDGKGYFNENLADVARYSGYSEESIKENPRINILAYAATYDALQREMRMTTRGISSHAPIIARLSEIPQDRSLHNSFASQQQFYAILKEMQNPHTQNAVRSREIIDMESVFGRENFRVLSAPSVNISDQGIRNLSDDTFVAPEGTEPPSCTHTNNTTDYLGAVWVPAHRRNFGSRGGEDVSYITIHTIQGSYASAISWFKNPNAGVSAHYVIRAMDGQITQMVCEHDKGFHVRTDNAKAIGIEHEGFIDEGAAWYTNAMYESSARLVKDICKRHGINPLKTYGGPPTDGVKALGNKCYHIKGHQHFRGNDHVDPGKYWDWDRFYRLINDNPEVRIFTERKGEILDPGGVRNYADQTRMAYLIKPKNATAIRLEFEEFDLEGDANKPYDYIDIYDGEDENGPFLGKFTGNQLPPVIIAKSGKVFMEFRSDCGENRKGWRLNYTITRKDADCPVPTDLQASNLFPMGVSLNWKNESKADHYLLYVKRRTLDTEWTKYRTSSSSVTLTGLSANSLYQWEMQAVCGTDTSGRVGSSFTTPGVSQKEAPQIYSISLDNGKFNDSGGEHAGYINNEAYIYRIIPPSNKKIELTFSEFDTESPHDYLVVYDGMSINAPVIDTLKGTFRPSKIVSTGNALTLLFISDGRTTGKGWKAQWTTGGKADDLPPIDDNREKPIVDNNNPDDNNSGGDTNSGTSNLNIPSEPFDPQLTFNAIAPETTPRLETSYSDDFTLQFDDKDKSGRGLVNRFYNLTENTSMGWRSNPNKGFYFDNFNRGLHPDWKTITGNWEVGSGRLVQTNTSNGNTNIYANVSQSRNDVYVYHWKARMSGPSTNKRIGLHIFCSDPMKENRGNSYFVWIRDAASGDKAEIYKTFASGDRFERKAVRSTRITKDKTYDYKVIYNPSKGRIELYINNNFTVSYNDPSPLRSGKGISFRTGNCVAEFDDLIVYKKRDRSVRLSVGSGGTNDIRIASPRPGEQAFRVNALIVDGNIRWSRVGTAGAQVNFGNTSGDLGDIPITDKDNDTSSGSSSTETPSTSTPSTGTGLLQASYSNDFSVNLPSGNNFYLPADYNGREWSANPLLGFFLDEFSERELRPEWTPIIGQWETNSNRLEQLDETATNSNIYVPLTQERNQVYLYHFRARLLTKGENKRFGFHFFCSDGKLTNRGDSYMVWFRNHGGNEDKVEIYRNDNNALSMEESAIVTLDTDKWYDIKVVLNGSSGQIDVFLENIKVLAWRDQKPAFRTGRYISFRTGSSKVQFDDLRVYQLANSRTINISVGNGGTDMLRFKSQSNRPAGRLYVIGQSGSGRWGALKQAETRIE